MIDGGLHWLRPLRELLGDPEAVVAVTRAHVQPGLRMEGETLAHALLRVRDAGDKPFTAQPAGSGPLVATYSAHMLHTAPMAHDACPYFRVTGSAGELVVAGDGLDPDGGGGLRLYDDAHPSGVELFSRAQRQGGFFLGFRGLWVEVARILAERDRVAAHRTVRDGAADVALAAAIYESARTGRWEDCAFLGDDLYDE